MTITIGLFGFGKTGSVVAKEIINDFECELKWVMRESAMHEGEYASKLLGFDHSEGKIYRIENICMDQFFKHNRVDVIIDFSSSSAVNVYKEAVKYGSKIVSAISNYDQEDIRKLKELSRQTAVLYSPNITVGINFLMEASKSLQKIAPNADIEIIEEHFRGKQDVSGTALRIAEELGLDKEQHVNSIRVGGIVGKHEVVFGLPNQTIRIVHESHNRAAFGQGAIYASKWIMGKETGIYSMEQALSLIMSGEEDLEKDAERFIADVPIKTS
ncbi:dihydrodipicolinate reductase [Lysinibacillus yapensis]|uniref:4-hydroxy-tetrahydrodipicolinate reductase n=1 Tax=Ureibacillus yapensis TaxID=2304605 RepID=A0A396SP28_9BACL|nr:dihydrodipicolinate reductase C-terminal domain-containing protein [Lysinibacillus yapensis]RHW37600.1 dihydrodipicolinate reductase [Lysinibacillus yapensis]